MEDFLKTLKGVAKETTPLERLNQAFLKGSVTITQYREALDQINIDKLNKDFREGKIDLDAYYSSLIKIEGKFSRDATIYTGVSDYIKQAGTLSQNIAQAITQTFSRLEDSIVEFTKSGRFEFAKFTQAILEDINRIIIRATIVRPLAEGILGAFGPAQASPAAAGSVGSGGSVGPSISRGFAKGGAFVGGVEYFANGGLVDKPTVFGFGGGRTGVMGEAGTEAILPLRRSSSGDLGVVATGQGAGGASNVQVNIINQTGGQVETRETENPDGSKAIEVLITSSVQNAFSTGKMDRVMNQTYGLNRRGA
jgi:lambda family phage tail tape measure protein